MELKLGQFVTDTSGKTWIIDEIDTDTDGEIHLLGNQMRTEKQQRFF